MRYFSIFFSAIFLLQACRQAGPDVSNIKVDLKVQRFEQGIFKLDTANLESGLDTLLVNYKGFGENFVWRILEADPQWSSDTLESYIKGFIQSYKPLYDSVQLQYPSFNNEAASITKMLQHVKYYFPNYKVPSKIITYVGPLDGYGDLLDTDAIVVGLQHHLGSDFSMYKSAFVSTTYPAYISKRFTREYIEVNAASNIINDIYPLVEADNTLIEMMVQQGKRLYLMQRLLPDAPEERIIGYTKDQWAGSTKQEAVIWAFFLQNNLLQSKDLNITKNYIGDSPKTQELGEAAPGNIGAFSGWQIVNSFMKKNKNLSLDKLMSTSNNMIYQQSKYKP